MHPNEAFKALIIVPRRRNGRTISQQLSPPPSSFVVNFGSGTGSLRSCLILISLSSICNGNFTIPNIPVYLFFSLLLLRYRVSLPDDDRIPGTTTFSVLVFGSALRVITFPKKTTWFGSSVKAPVENSKSVRVVTVLETGPDSSSLLLRFMVLMEKKE